ncbi:MAG: sugar transferase [Deltaproteobacteria bacterium]|nr:sugar transferase [Deltaproteobacteria bacterium]
MSIEWWTQSGWHWLEGFVVKLKRIFDLVCSGLGLLLLSPLFLMIAVLITLESKGPVFFRQERVGLNGRVFQIHKFRTMAADAERNGLQITVGPDQRITRVGAVLRKYKLDELAQLIDVFVGDMSLVGPRPEVPKYIACYPAAVRAEVLSVRPGITDWASIQFKDENDILGRAPDAEKAYIEEVLPIKQRYYVEYVRDRSFFGDLRIIFVTIFAVFGR